jgi:hypothetical protein
MKAFLMYRDRDFDLNRASPPNEAVLIKDLELETLISAMGLKDPLVVDVAKKALLAGRCDDLDTMIYRQGAVRDCLESPEAIRQLYLLAGEAIERQKKVWGSFREYPSGQLDNAVSRMEIYVDVLKRVRKLADRDSVRFKSEAFTRLFTMLARELNDEYFALIGGHLKQLKFRHGVLVSADLGKGLKGANYVLRRPLRPLGNWFTRLFAEGPPAYTIRLAPRDESGAQAMSELRDRGLGLAANALAKSAEHVLSFFQMMQTELAFYVGCINLHERIVELGATFSFPLPTEPTTSCFSCKDLYDIGLALSMSKRPVGNDVVADGKPLIIVTGANQGGKTTFLRSIGIAQLMMQSGIFVPATYLRANSVDGVFTHYKREEDATMKSGKLDEELSRMNDIVERLSPHALILFNESFSATNEREGSEISRQIVSALLERGHKVVFVSHQFDFANGFYEAHLDSALFLRADRQSDGRRSFKLVEGKPLGTSYGEDVFREIFLGEEGAGETTTLDRSRHLEASSH